MIFYSNLDFFLSTQLEPFINRLKFKTKFSHHWLSRKRILPAVPSPMIFISLRWLVAEYTSLIETLGQAVFFNMFPNVTVKNST